MQLHMFSSADIAEIVNVMHTLVDGKKDATVAYLPAADYGNRWVNYTEQLFKDFARVLTLDAGRLPPADFDAALAGASVVYLPGGNTYLLSHRLHESGLVASLRHHIQHGTPVVAFSAGTVYCGQDILITNDINVCASSHFAGLGLTRFNFQVHYPPQKGERRVEADDRLRQYHEFQTHPILALEDGAYLYVEDEKIRLVLGKCWRFDPGAPPRKYKPGFIYG